MYYHENSMEKIQNKVSLDKKNTDFLKLLIPATPKMLVSYLNDPISTKQPIFNKENPYWYIIYNLNNTNIPIQADSNATYFENNFVVPNENSKIKLVIDGYYPYCSYFSLSLYNGYSGDLIASLKNESIPAKHDSENPFLVGNQFYTPLKQRKFSVSVSNMEKEQPDILLSSFVKNLVVILRIYDPYYYTMSSKQNPNLSNLNPNVMTPEESGYLPYGVPGPYTGSKSQHYFIPTWKYSIDGVLRETKVLKQPVPIFKHLVTRPIPLPDRPFPFYRLSKTEIPYGDGEPDDICTNYLSCFFYVAPKYARLSISLPDTLDLNLIENQSYGTRHDVMYMSWSMYSYNPLSDFTINSNNLLSMGKNDVYQVLLCDAHELKNNGKIENNILHSNGKKIFVLPIDTGEQNILIQRSKGISEMFSKNVTNVPCSVLTIDSSFQPETFVANRKELGEYLPVISLIEDESGREVTTLKQAIQFL